MGIMVCSLLWVMQQCMGMIYVINSMTRVALLGALLLSPGLLEVQKSTTPSSMLCKAKPPSAEGEEGFGFRFRLIYGP